MSANYEHVVYLFHRGPFDGASIFYGPAYPGAPFKDYCAKLWRDTEGGKIGKQFEVEHIMYVAWEWIPRHLYEVTGNEVSESGKLLVHATHVRALPGPDEWRIPPPSQTEPEPPPELPPGSGKDG